MPKFSGFANAKIYSQAELDQAIEQNNKKGFDMLAILGISKERAITVWNGIEVLSTRYRKDRVGYEYSINQAVKAKNEACAVICEEIYKKHWDCAYAVKQCIEAIRESR